MSTLTKEWLQQTIAEYESNRDELPFGLDTNSAIELQAFKLALASLETEAVAVCQHQWKFGGANKLQRQKQCVKCGRVELASQPAPVSVPDERYQHLSQLYHAQEKRLFKLAQHIKGSAFDKYAHSPSQAIDVLESALFGENDDTSRAAMLQGAEPVSQNEELPLDYLQGHKDGLEWAAQMAEANHPETGDWLYDDPLELARAIRKGTDMRVEPMQEWIPCSERMPEKMVSVLATGDWFDYAVTAWDGGGWLDFDYEPPVTHWMPLPAAPQQEVK